jgi:hypothetical protein
VEAIDPFSEMKGRRLRSVVIECLEDGRILIPRRDGGRSHVQERMDERHVSAPEIEATLRSGLLATDSCVAGKWRYRARKNDVEVIFTFDVDDEGNLLVVITVMRKERQP